jgi:DNA-binding MarR family transcriptional regulator
VADEENHPSQRLDDVVHQRVRLGILAVLAEADQADFGYLKESLGLTDGNLSRHLQVLEEAGFVHIHKTFEGRRPRTWISSTKPGRAAFASELAALRDLIASVDPSGNGYPARRGNGRG